jgi:lysophospholipase-2
MVISNAIHIVSPLAEHTHTVILLHGRDSTAFDFANEFFESQASDGRILPEIFPNFKWVFPTAKLRQSAPFGVEMSQWFDMWSVEEPQERQELQIDGLVESIASIVAVVNAEAAFVPPERIFLGGISQGCATAIHALMHCDTRLAGFTGFCSWLPFEEDMNDVARRSTPRGYLLLDIQMLLRPVLVGSSHLHLRNGANPPKSPLTTPVFLSHSKNDDVVPIRNGEGLCQGLKSIGMAVTWKEYENGGHWVDEPQGVDDMVIFLQNCQINDGQ